MRIAEHIVVLDIAGEHGAIHPVLLRGQGRLMLVDAGYPMQLELIRHRPWMLRGSPWTNSQT